MMSRMLPVLAAFFGLRALDRLRANLADRRFFADDRIFTHLAREGLLAEFAHLRVGGSLVWDHVQRSVWRTREQKQRNQDQSPH